MLGDYLYKQTPKDLHSLGIDLYRVTRTLNQTAATDSFFFLIPNDRALILQTALVTANPQASGDYSTRVDISTGRYSTTTAVINEHLLDSSMLGEDFNIGGYTGQVNYAFEFDNLLIPAGCAIGARSRWSAATGGHSSVVYFSGYTIPRGNIAF